MEKQITTKEHEITLYRKDKEKEMAVKEHEMTIKLNAKENDWKLKMKDLENEHKIKMLQMETKLAEMEKGIAERDITIQDMNQEIEILKKVAHANDEKPNQVSKIPLNNMTTIHCLIWGAEYFHEGEKSLHLYLSYAEWYQAISRMMVNKEVFLTDKYLFMRKEFDRYRTQLDFTSKRKGAVYKEGSEDFLAEGLSPALWDIANFFLFHPKEFDKRLKMRQISKRLTYEYRRVSNISNDFYFGDERSAIVFGILK